MRPFECLAAALLFIIAALSCGDESAPPDTAPPPIDDGGPVDAAGDAAPSGITCGACWDDLGYDAAMCGAQLALPFGNLSGYRTCGECAKLYSPAECYAVPVPLLS